MKLGIHAYAWCSQWSNDTLDLIDRAQQLSLDFIELPLLCPETFEAAAVRRRLEALDYEAVTSTVLTADTDLTSEQPEIRARGVAYLRDCVLKTQQIGASSLSGVIYSQHVKPVNRRPRPQEWEWAAEGLREVADYALDLGVTIGLEPVNRYETYLLNTCEQALRLRDMIGRPNVRIHLDTYHMNIEEKSFYEATKLAGDSLVHYHLCENDRGIPGTGLVDWDGIFRALAEIGYQGYAALESFVDCTDNMQTWVWRQLAPSGDDLVREGLAFVRSMQARYGL